MADTLFSLANLLTINNKQLTDVEFNQVLNSSPFIRQIATVAASNGTVHQYLKMTTAPSAAFRAVNAGLAQTPDVDTEVTATLKILDASWKEDLAIVDKYKHGRTAFAERRTLRALQQALFIAEKQIFCGTVHGSAAGFAGLADEATANQTADANVVNATGTTAGTGSSAWLIRVAEDGVALVGHPGGVVAEDPTIIQALDGSGHGFASLYVALKGWLALQVGTTNDFVRIANLTEDSTKGLTDDLIYRAWAKFPSDAGPTHIVMNRRSLAQLRESRTATSPTGAPAPMPGNVDGLPIVVTDAILSTETLLS